MRHASAKNGVAKRVGENLYIRGGTYYAVIRVRGKQVWKSLKTSNRNLAKQELVRAENLLQVRGELVRKKNAPIFQDAVDIFLDSSSRDGVKEKYLNSMRDHFRVAGRGSLAGLNIAKIHTAQIQEYLRNRFKKTSGRTANLDLIYIRKLFAFAVSCKWRWDNPAKGIPSFPHKEREVPVPSWSEISAVIEVLKTFPIKGGKKAAEFIELLALSGLRVSEAQSLAWSDIDFEKGILIVRQGKFDKSRIIDLFPALKEFLERLKQGLELDGLLFLPRNGRGYDPRNALSLACKTAKVSAFSYHGLRHAWATRLVEQGVDFATIAKWMGHSDGGMLVAKRYGTHSRREHFQRVAQGINLSVHEGHTP